VTSSALAADPVNIVRGPQCIAHRGASGAAPENTLRAFARAVDAGATWLELDVQMVDDRVVVLHDDTVDRTTDGRGRAAGFSFADLRRLDAGQGQQIPLLEEVLALVSGRATINVELKGEATAGPTAAILAAALARGGWQAEQFVLSSFDWPRLALAHERLPQLPIAPLLDGHVALEALEAALRLGASAIHIGKWAARAGAVRDAHARSLAVRVHTVNERWEYEFMRRIGVDAVFTDHPERVLAWSRTGGW